MGCFRIICKLPKNAAIFALVDIDNGLRAREVTPTMSRQTTTFPIYLIAISTVFEI